MTHGVSGFACTGAPGDFQEAVNGEPWQVIVNDPIRSYMNAQSHIGIPFNSFSESWRSGELRDVNYDAAPYRIPMFRDPIDAPPVDLGGIPIAAVEYPTWVAQTSAQQLPVSRIHENVRIAILDRQNADWEGIGYNKYVEGENAIFRPRGLINTDPGTVNFQGASTAAGTHPNNDTANQQTTGNTTKPEFNQGQTPSQKLPSGVGVGSLLPGDAPALWDLAPPPDPPVLPGEGTAPLRPTNPEWW